MSILDKLSEVLESLSHIDQVYETNDGVRYDVATLIRLSTNLPINDTPLSELARQVNNDKIWGYGREDTPDDLIGISDVISSPNRYKSHYDDMVSSDMQYPIIIAPNKDVADGNHRLGRAVIDDMDAVQSITFPSWEYIESAIIDV